MILRCICEDDPELGCPIHDQSEHLRGTLRRMAAAGQRFAEHWGHEPWSDSWALHVATEMYAAMDAERPPRRTALSPLRRGSA